MVVMDQFTRRIIGFAVSTGNLDGPAVCRMFSEVISGFDVPGYLGSDHDPLFEFHRWSARAAVSISSQRQLMEYFANHTPLHWLCITSDTPVSPRWKSVDQHDWIPLASIRWSPTASVSVNA